MEQRPTSRLRLVTLFLQGMLIGTGAGVEGEGIQVDRFSSFVLTFSLASFFGVQYESISPERLMVATIDGATAVYGKAAAAEPDVKEDEEEEGELGV